MARLKNPYKARHYQVGGDVERLVGIQEAVRPTWGPLHEGGQTGIDAAYVGRLVGEGRLSPEEGRRAIAATQPAPVREEGPAPYSNPTTRDVELREAFGPSGVPVPFQGNPGDRIGRLGETVVGNTLSGAALSGIADYQLRLQQRHVDEGTGLTLTSPSGFPVTVHQGTIPGTLVVTGNTEGVPHDVYVDQALRQGLPTFDTLVATGQREPNTIVDRVTSGARTLTDTIGLTQPVETVQDAANRVGVEVAEGVDPGAPGIDPELPGGAFGGPGGFVGANDVVYDTAEEATRSLDRADAAARAAQAAEAARVAREAAEATRRQEEQRAAARAAEANRLAQEEARRQAAAHVHIDNDGQQHSIREGRQAVVDRHGNAVTDSRGNAVTSRNDGGGGGGGDPGGK